MIQGLHLRGPNIFEAFKTIHLHMACCGNAVRFRVIAHDIDIKVGTCTHLSTEISPASLSVQIRSHSCKSQVASFHRSHSHAEVPQLFLVFWGCGLHTSAKDPSWLPLVSATWSQCPLSQLNGCRSFSISTACDDFMLPSLLASLPYNEGAATSPPTDILRGLPQKACLCSNELHYPLRFTSSHS